MKLDTTVPNVIGVILSRRNLETLLAKLNGHPKNSEVTIAKREDDTLLVVCGEENGPHYADRGYPPGEMHPETEKHLTPLNAA